MSNINSNMQSAWRRAARVTTGIFPWLGIDYRRPIRSIFVAAALLDTTSLSFNHVNPGLHGIRQASSEAAWLNKGLVPVGSVLSTVMAGGFYHTAVDTVNFVINPAKPQDVLLPFSSLVGAVCDLPVTWVPKEGAALKPYVRGVCRGLLELLRLQATLKGMVVGTAAAGVGAAVEAGSDYATAQRKSDTAVLNKISFNLPQRNLG